jgi:hypothetical protein
MKSIVVLVAALCFQVFAQEMGTISPDTLIPEQQVTISKRMEGLEFERTYDGDSVAKRNDKFIFKLNVKRDGEIFDSTAVTIQPKTRGLDTLNGGRGYTWRIKFQLLPR